MSLRSKKSIPRAGSPEGTAIWSIGSLAIFSSVEKLNRKMQAIESERGSWGIMVDSDPLARLWQTYHLETHYLFTGLRSRDAGGSTKSAHRVESGHESDSSCEQASEEST